jgi:hypothetical protein
VHVLNKQPSQAYSSGGLEAFIVDNPYRQQALAFLKSLPNPSQNKIIRKVASAIHNEIDEINIFYKDEVQTLGGWELIRSMMVIEWKKALSEFIDPDAVKSGGIIGLRPEMSKMIKSIFPNIEYHGKFYPRRSAYRR